LRTTGATAQRVYRWLLRDSVNHGLKKNVLFLSEGLKMIISTPKNTFRPSVITTTKRKKILLKAINVCNLLLTDIPNSSFQGYVFPSRTAGG
jgi:hypothetical protein